MAKKRQPHRRIVLNYPPQWFEPEELLSFIELRPFTRRWDELGVTDLDLGALQVALMARPNAGAVIRGTGGLRKLRFSPKNWPMGKSGALRVCYAYFEDVGTIVLAIVYEKGEKDDLANEEKKALRKALDRVKQSLLSRPYRFSTKKSVEER